MNKPFKVNLSLIDCMQVNLTRETVFGWIQCDAKLENDLWLALELDGEIQLQTPLLLTPQMSSDLEPHRRQFHFELLSRIREIAGLAVRIGAASQSTSYCHPARCFEGFVDIRGTDSAVGWAWQIGDPDFHPEVEIIVGGQAIATLPACHLREDLLRAGIGSGDYGFIWNADTAEEREALASTDLEFRLKGTDFVLKQLALANDAEAGAEHSRDDAELASEVDANVQISRGIVSGWVLHQKSGTPRRVNIEVDGELFWSGLAQRIAQHPTLGEIRNAGFKVSLPLPAKETSHRLIAVTHEDGSHFQGSPFLIPHGDQFIGYVENITTSGNSTMVNGWCIDTLAPSSRVELVLRDAEKVIATGVTYDRRLDLSATGYDAPYAAFTLTAPKAMFALAGPVEVLPGRSLRALPMLFDPSRMPANQNICAPAPARRLSQPDDVIDGTIDEVNGRQIRGWARNASNPDAIVVLDCWLDGRLYSTTVPGRYRADLAKHFNDHGFHEYVFELTPAASLQYPGSLVIEARVGVSQIKQKYQHVSQPVPRSKLIHARDRRVMVAHESKSLAQNNAALGVSIIVINRDGAQLLDSMFRTFAAHNSFADYEFLIVDHGSTDDSEDVTARWATALNVRWVAREGNFSFSASNNYAAELAGKEILLFLNNDVSFVGDILESAARYFSDPGIGCVGIRLLDDAPIPRPDGEAAIQHLGVHFQQGKAKSPFQPFESRYADAWLDADRLAIEVPVVTGAFMLCRRSEFNEIGGFDEQYFYGFEDVDLCLKYQSLGKTIVGANQLEALHLRGFSRAKMDRQFDNARNHNNVILDDRWGFWLRRTIREQRFARPAFWSSLPVRIAFVVSEASEETLAGDYFTALELASQLSARFPCDCGFLEKSAKTEYDLAGFDVVIAMLDDYAPNKIKNGSPHLIKIAWVRNWFERFAERESATEFDAVWASSQDACDHLAARLFKPVQLMPIAGNSYRFKSGKMDADLESDYCFTGSYWGLNREIIQLLDPAALPFRFAIYGTGWEQVPSLAPFSRGSLPYKRMPDVYANTRIVIDDANHVTKTWGAVNSRVFDAIIAGALVITNGTQGAASLFDGLLPTFTTVQELEGLLWFYLLNEDERLAKVAQLQRLVQDRHTYQLRAVTSWNAFGEISRNQIRFAIKIGTPSRRVQQEWGDYHFAVGIKRALDALGHSARIDCIDAWTNPAAAGDDVVIVLRGLTTYETLPHQINLMWNISHPDKISVAEYNSYDHIFVASAIAAGRLCDILKVPVSPLLQCTDPNVFNLDVPLLARAPALLFVGNSRNEFRQVVADAIAVNLPIEVYGSRWESFLPSSLIKGQNIPNGVLASYYRSAGVLLNDHWKDMRDAGFVSNRLFDGVACGARIISDDVPGMQALFGNTVRVYHSAAELARLVDSLAGESEEDRRERTEMAELVAAKHTFQNRVETIMLTVERIWLTKMCPSWKQPVYVSSVNQTEPLQQELVVEAESSVL